MSALLSEVRTSQLSVLNVLKRRPAQGFTDEELVHSYRLQAAAGRVPRQSESGIRTRRAELVKLGLVVPTGVKRAMSTGGEGQVFIPK